MAQHGPRRRARQTKLGQGEIVGFQLLGAQDSADDRIRVAHGVAQRKGGHGGGKPHGSGKANGAECARHGIHLRNSSFCGNCNNSFILLYSGGGTDSINSHADAGEFGNRCARPAADYRIRAFSRR